MTSEKSGAVSVRRRIVLHFAGFEPLDGKAHYERYVRTAAQSAHVWNYSIGVGPYSDERKSFDVGAHGPDWITETRIHLFDYDARIEAYRRRPLAVRIAAGFGAAFRIATQGAARRYMQHAWRFGLFFLFPFLLMSLGLLAAALIAALPLILSMAGWHLIWSLALAAVFFRFAFLPFSDRYHTLHLFSDWEMALAMARLDDPAFGELLEEAETRLMEALTDDADEIVITSHSMGSNFAAHVLGAALEKHPRLLAGKSVAFVTLGGALLQCAFLRSAGRLRERVGLIARQEGLFWLDVQCLTDAVNFFRTRTLDLCGHGDLAPASIQAIRFRHMLDPAHYKRIKRDMLRVHRQYVLGPDRRSEFDFTLLTAGPFPTTRFAQFSPRNPPPLTVSGGLTTAQPGLATVH